MLSARRRDPIHLGMLGVSRDSREAVESKLPFFRYIINDSIIFPACSAVTCKGRGSYRSRHLPSRVSERLFGSSY